MARINADRQASGRRSGGLSTIVLFLLLAGLSVSAAEAQAAKDLIPVAGTVSGPAPFYAHFYAGTITGEMDEISFHESDLTWNFGDPRSGVWNLTGRDRNSAKGAVAAHVFEYPGTYTVTLSVRDARGKIKTASQTVTVTDPDRIFSGMKTICVSDTDDFTGAPMDARWISTKDLKSIVEFAIPGSRMLFRRGGTWVTDGLDWPDGAGPLTIGAFGPIEGLDELGIATNAPVISVRSGNFLPLDFKQNWTVMDIHFISGQESGSGGGDESGVFGGAMDFRRILLLRLKIEGFSVGIGWSFWNVSSLAQIDQMAVVSCDLRDARTNVMYVGGERLALLGNRLTKAEESHVLRVWQAYRSVISNNVISGSSVGTDAGRHALKLHGPGEAQLGPKADTGNVAHRTEFTVVSDNVFGGSGPWPVNIAPQNGASDERLSHIVFERNLYRATLGPLSETPLQVALRISARNVTVRNNVLDGSGWGKYFAGISAERTGVEPSPDHLRIYNNTIVKTGNNLGENWFGISLSDTVMSASVLNNLVLFPDAPGAVGAVKYSKTAIPDASNILVKDTAFKASPDGEILGKIKLKAISAAKDAGQKAVVYDDFYGVTRSDGKMDLGAYEINLTK